MPSLQRTASSSGFRVSARVVLALSLLGMVALSIAAATAGTASVDSKKTRKRNQQAPAPSDAAAANCRVDVASVPLPGVPEASGLAASRRSPGVLWSHGDSGAPILIALDGRGAQKGKVRLNGATLVDWEDVAVGPCGSASCVYAADIGDNRGARKSITVYRFPEPLPRDAATQPVEALHASFPDMPQDAEALFVLGKGDIFIVTKGDTGPVALYRFPSGVKAGSKAATLEKIGVLQNGRTARRQWVTGASASLDGRWVSLRTHGDVAFYDAARVVKGDFNAPLRFALSGLEEVQGEGIALGERGSVFLVGEGGGRGAAGSFGSLVCYLPDSSPAPGH